MKRIFAVAALSLALLSGCDSLGKDRTVPEGYQSVKTPGGYSAVITWCDHGNRLYMVYKDDRLVVVPNAQDCPRG